MPKKLAPLAAASLLVVAASTAHAAATATLVKGVLKIRGDAAADAVILDPSPDTPGALRVDAPDTFVNGAAFVDFVGVKSIDVDLGAGADSLIVGASGGGRVALRGAHVVETGGTLTLGVLATDVVGNVDVHLGPGADDVTFSNTSITGTLAVDLDPRDGTGDTDSFGVINCQVGTMNVFFGPGDERPTIASSDSSPGTPTTFKNVFLDLGAGNDALSWDDSSVTGTLRVLLGPGDDTFGLLHLPQFSSAAPKIASLDVDCGDGRDIVLVGSNSTPGTIVGKVKFVGGAGNDVLALNNVQCGPVVADFGDGDDQFATYLGTMTKTVRVTMGDGADTLNLNGTQFLGALTVDGGPGSDDSQIRGGSTFQAAPAILNFESSQGAGPPFTVQDDSNAGNKITVDLATGAYTLFLDGTSAATGTATLKAKGAVLTVTAAGDLPFVAKIDFSRNSAKAVVKHGMGMTTTISDSNTSDD